MHVIAHTAIMHWNVDVISLGTACDEGHKHNTSRHKQTPQTSLAWRAAHIGGAPCKSQLADSALLKEHSSIAIVVCAKKTEAKTRENALLGKQCCRHKGHQ